jgi:hypothetical protein
MKYIAIILCLAGLAAAVGYNDWQQGAADGLMYGFKMGQAYQNALNGVNITGFNAEVDIYNSWVRANFGEDPYLLMSKMNTPGIDLTKPVLIANNTTVGGINHAIDGGVSGPSYTTNDVNLLPGNVDVTRATNTNPLIPKGQQYLPWV